MGHPTCGEVYPEGITPKGLVEVAVALAVLDERETLVAASLLAALLETEEGRELLVTVAAAMAVDESEVALSPLTLKVALAGEARVEF